MNYDSDLDLDLVDMEMAVKIASNWSASSIKPSRRFTEMIFDLAMSSNQ